MAETPDDQVLALRAELAALRTEMQNLTATVSHDLRAPLRHIVSYAELVQEDAGPQLGAEVLGFLNTITDSARHMGVLLDGLVELSRLGSVPLNPDTVHLQALVEQVCAELGAQHPTRSLDWQIATELPSVQADAVLLRLALTQVLGNAIKFTTPRTQAVIEIRAADVGGAGENGLVQLQVQDNGVGFNPAMEAKLFQVFGRLHSAREFDGIGMGLALTRKVMQRMGGTVGIAGVLQRGCCVTLGLPAVPA